MWEQALLRSAGGTPTSRNRLKEEAFLELEIPLPPLDEQRLIATRLERISNAMSTADTLSSNCDASWLSLVTALHLSASHEVFPLGKLLRLDEDKVPVLPSGTYPQAGVRAYGRGLFETAPVQGGATTYRHLNRLHAGFLVMSQVKGWEGAVAMVDSRMADRYVSPEYRTFCCEPERLLPQYMAHLVAAPWFYERLAPASRGVGARRERVRPELFLALELPMPRVEEQRRLLKTMDRVAELRELAAGAREARSGLHRALLARAF